MSRSLCSFFVLSLGLFLATPSADSSATFDFTCDPSRPLTVNSGARVTLHPGTYGNVLLKMKSVVTLEPGVFIGT